jgi:hypothetical protein
MSTRRLTFPLVLAACAVADPAGGAPAAASERAAGWLRLGYGRFEDARDRVHG